MKKNPLYLLLSVLVIFSMFLSSCGSAEDDYYYEEEAYYTEEPAADEDYSDATEAPSAESAPGEVVYDFGFNPAENGFSFSNYGDDIPATNLTADELRRMFGDQVCSRLDGDECTLTPPAEQWMEQINGAHGRRSLRRHGRAQLDDVHRADLPVRFWRLRRQRTGYQR